MEARDSLILFFYVTFHNVSQLLSVSPVQFTLQAKHSTSVWKSGDQNNVISHQCIKTVLENTTLCDHFA